MSSILKVDTLQDSGGNAIITSNGSGTITTPGITTGKVLQVLFNNSNATVSTTSQSYVTSNQSLSITPSSASKQLGCSKSMPADNSSG